MYSLLQQLLHVRCFLVAALVRHKPAAAHDRKTAAPGTMAIHASRLELFPQVCVPSKTRTSTSRRCQARYAALELQIRTLTGAGCPMCRGTLGRARRAAKLWRATHVLRRPMT